MAADMTVVLINVCIMIDHYSLAVKPMHIAMNSPPNVSPSVSQAVRQSVSEWTLNDVKSLQAIVLHRSVSYFTHRSFMTFTSFLLKMSQIQSKMAARQPFFCL